MANRYWIGGTGTWASTSHWSTSSGGPSGASVPTSSDNAIFDTSSSASPFTVTLTADGNAKNLDTSALSSALLITGSPYKLNIFGNIDLASTTFEFGFKTWHIPPVSATINIDLLSALPFYTQNDGSVTLLSTIRATSITVGGGVGANFNSMNFDIETRDFWAGGSVTLGSSTLQLQTWIADSSSTVSAGSATIILTGYWTSPSNILGSFAGGGKTYGYVTLASSSASKAPLLGHYSSTIAGDSNATIATLEIVGGLQVRAGATINVTNIIADGDSVNRLLLKSYPSGARATLRKTSGSATLTWADIKDTAVTGGATWNALYSIDSGNNTGWNIIGLPTWGSVASAEAFESNNEVKPGPATMPVDSIFTAEAIGSPSLVQITLLDSTASSEVFGTLLLTAAMASVGDIASEESVSSVSFTTRYILPSSIASEEGFDLLLVIMYLIDLGAVAGASAVEAPVFTQSPPPPPPPTDWSALGKEDEKVYVYKVSDRAGNYIGIWPDVVDDLKYTHRINTAGTTTTVRLARSANSTREVRSNLLTEAGDILTTEDGSRLVSVYETPNTVGEDTDVDLGYLIDVYVHYGEFGHLLTEDGVSILTEDGDNLIVASGAPLGTPAFQGSIMDYESVYGDQEYVTVTLASHGLDLSRKLVKDGSNTNVTFSSTALETISKSILDTNPGRITYDSGSIETTGVSRTLKFQLNSKLEAIQSVFDQTPDGWYWYGGVAERLLYLKAKHSTYDHRFIMGKHIKSLSLKRSIEDLKNSVYFVGGEVTPGTPSSTLFKLYEDAASQTSWGLGAERIVDRRYTLTTSTAARAQKTLSMFAQPIYTTTLVISSARYDIESIRLGQTVGFANIGNFIDALPPLQIVELSYEPTQVTLQVGGLLDRQVDTLSGIEAGLANEQYESLPNAPS